MVFITIILAGGRQRRLCLKLRETLSLVFRAQNPGCIPPRAGNVERLEKVSPRQQHSAGQEELRSHGPQSHWAIYQTQDPRVCQKPAPVQSLSVDRGTVTFLYVSICEIG